MITPSTPEPTPEEVFVARLNALLREHVPGHVDAYLHRQGLRGLAEFLEMRAQSSAESVVRDLLADTEHSWPLSRLGEKTLCDMIHELKPNCDVKAGKQFLALLLGAKGVSGFNLFMDKATAAIHQKGKLERDDFDDFEWDLYQKCKPDLSRRKILVGVAAVGGAMLSGHGIGKFGEQMLEDERTQRPQEKQGWKRHLSHGVEAMKTAEPYVEMAGGAVTLAYAYKEYWDARLEQVSHAINALSREAQRGTRSR